MKHTRGEEAIQAVKIGDKKYSSFPYKVFAYLQMMRKPEFALSQQSLTDFFNNESVRNNLQEYTLKTSKTVRTLNTNAPLVRKLTSSVPVETLPEGKKVIIMMR